MPKDPKSPLNVLLITSDQQHWNTLSCLGSEVRTPHLDELARQGTLFNRAYCPNPTCTPTRASIITGQYPSQHGAWALGTKLPESARTVGDEFQEAGYDTALIGKAHFQPLRETEAYSSLESYPILQDLDFWRRFDQPFYGFKHVELARNHVDEAHIGQHYAIWMEEKGEKDWRRFFQPPTGTTPGQRGKWNIPEELHYNTWISERTNARLQRYEESAEPFFLWASFFDPHPPYIVPEPWDTMYDPKDVTVPELTPGEHDRNAAHFGKTQEEAPDFSEWKEESGHSMHGCESHLHSREELAKDIATYYGMTSLLDKGVGSILGQLEASGLADNTLVIFTSDHGHFFGQHGLIAKGPFHYEDMLRVPFISRFPGQHAIGKTTDSLMSLVDLAPTMLSACGLDVPLSMSGIDQSKTLKGEVKSQRDHVLVENRHQPTQIHLNTYIDDRYKITVYRDRDYGEIFDLQEDPGEIRNLWNDPETQELKTQLLTKLLQAELKKEPLWMPRIYGA